MYVKGGCDSHILHILQSPLVTKFFRKPLTNEPLFEYIADENCKASCVVTIFIKLTGKESVK